MERAYRARISPHGRTRHVPMDAIKSATSRAAEMLDMQGQIGVIASGAYADIIALSGDPLSDIKVLQNVQFVMKDGKVFRNETK